MSLHCRITMAWVCLYRTQNLEVARVANSIPLLRDAPLDSVHQLARRQGRDHSNALAADQQRLFGERPGQALRRPT
jgi:hypothetical protein